MNRRNFIKSTTAVGVGLGVVPGVSSACTREEFDLSPEDNEKSAPDEDEIIATGEFADGNPWVVKEIDVLEREEYRQEPNEPRVSEVKLDQTDDEQYLSYSFDVYADVIIPDPDATVEFNSFSGMSWQPILGLSSFSDSPFYPKSGKARVRVSFEVNWRMERILVVMDNISYDTPVIWA